jgi:hypothetical protein
MDPDHGLAASDRSVVHVFRHAVDHVRILVVRGSDGKREALRTTDDHPFWVVGQGFIRAGRLVAGAMFVEADGRHARLVSTRREARPEGVPVYNFEVDGTHTYLVGRRGILVHNNDCAKKLSRKGALKAQKLPTRGKVRYVPPENWTSTQPLPRGPQKGFLDKFGNEWRKGPSRTKGEPFEWDVQPPGEGFNPFMQRLSRNGSHVNVSQKGHVTHKSN